jgi:hypothetical protein
VGAEVFPEGRVHQVCGAVVTLDVAPACHVHRGAQEVG